MPPPYPNTIMPDSGEVKAMHTSGYTSWASDHFPKEPLIDYERTLFARANEVWIPTSPQQQKIRDSHTEDAQTPRSETRAALGGATCLLLAHYASF